MSNWLRRMESRGHLRRQRNPVDGRSQLVQLTARGARLTEQCFPAFALAIETFRDALEIDEQVLLEVLEAMSTAFAVAVEKLRRRSASASLPECRVSLTTWAGCRASSGGYRVRSRTNSKRSGRERTYPSVGKH